MAWHAPPMFANYSHTLTALKWYVVLAISFGVLNEFSIHCLFFLKVIDERLYPQKQK